MIRASLLALFSTLIICGFCGKEFISVGRHSWRCKSKVLYDQENSASVKQVMEMPSQDCLPVKSAVKCCCGKICKGARGLKMHQCSCRVIDQLGNELQDQMTDALNEKDNEETTDRLLTDMQSFDSQENFPDLKKGIKLPKSPLQWSTANDFFKLTFSNYPITPQDLNNNINTMTTVIYKYFCDNFGSINNNSHNTEFVKKYESYTARVKENFKAAEVEQW